MQNYELIEVWLERLRQMPLKSDQKLNIFRDHLLSKEFYEQLRSADRVVKRFVKSALHLPMSTGDPFLYAGVRNGRRAAGR